ncbi:MAG: type 2 isopentenyl-diphosphate Delta-isomerase [Thermoplasmata archaeon]|nr:MAG: type 2 isopentenyl-diphosphate Delta-isomerase [Thermoplasmata archaeon]
MINPRKLEHLNICLAKNVECRRKTGFDEVFFVHRALPEINKDDIDLTINFLGKKISAPIMIASMTGGHEKAKRINENLAIAAEHLNIPLGVGSQRAAIENPKLKHTFTVVREIAQTIPIFANLGVVQFSQDYGIEEAKEAVEMIDADALALHLNPLQEAIQKEGDTNFRRGIENIRKLAKELDVPIIAKETGAGIAREEAILLEKAGVKVIDVGGVGGTSFAAVEYYRDKTIPYGKLFWDWGIPTAVSTVECSEYTNLKIISTGGIRNGIQVAKAIALGADLCGIALPLLKKARKSHRYVEEEIKRIIEELKIAMFLVGAEKVEDLKKCDVVITGDTREWLETRGIDCRKFANRRSR